MSASWITVGVNKDVSTRLGVISAIALKDTDLIILKIDVMVRVNFQ